MNQSSDGQAVSTGQRNSPGQDFTWLHPAVQAETVARRKLSLLELARELGNVSKACRIVGYSRQQFYEIRRNFQVYGDEGLLDRMPGARGPHPNRVASEVEEAILAHALTHPAHGAQRVADELMLRGVQVSSGGVRGVWIRNGLETRHERLLRLEKTVRESDFELTEEQIQALERFDPEYRERHIEVKKTGKLVAVDTLATACAATPISPRPSTPAPRGMSPRPERPPRDHRTTPRRPPPQWDIFDAR